MESFIGPPGTESFGDQRATRGDGPDECANAQRVLVVEDHTDSARSLISIIHLWGHDARVARTGAEAIVMAGDYRPHVVLLDISLPDMDGYAVARVLRETPGLRDTTIMAVTGHGRDEDRQRALDAGFDRHLLKPLELDELEGLLAGLADAVR